MPNMQAASLRSFFEKTPFKHSFMLCRIILHYLINNMSFTYTYQKGCSAPTHFLVNTGFTISLYKTICFDHLIKAYNPTPTCLHQSIEGSLELAQLVAPLGSINLLVASYTTLLRDIHLRNVVLTSICQIS